MSATATATKSGPKGRFKTYDDLLPHTSLPLARRRELAIGRNGAKVKPRAFHLSDEDIAALKEEYKETKVFPNPHNKGFYYFLVAALVEMGINEEHSKARVMKKVESLMSDPSTLDGEGKDATTAWERFVNKDARNAATGKSYDARFDQNITVLQRLTGRTPYGRKILEVGQKVMGQAGGVIDLLVHDSGAQFLRLNTKSDRPVNQLKVRGMGSNAAIAAEKAEARAARKPKKVKAKKSAPAAEPQTADATSATA